MHEHLVAPRPVRIASHPVFSYSSLKRTPPAAIRGPVSPIHLVSPSDSLAKLKLDQADHEPDDDHPLPSSGSPRSPMTLPPETLEEFLSILRPSIMPFHPIHKYSTSPPIRSHKRMSMPALSPLSHYVGGGKASPLGSPDFVTQEQGRFSCSPIPDREYADLELPPSSWRGFNSPVSRNQTMNPFARRPSHENLALGLSTYSYPPQSPNRQELTSLSPAMVPLPPSASPSASNQKDHQSDPDE